MKILCLSDLHQRMTDISDVIHQRRFTPFLQSIRDLVEDTRPDVAVVTGDTVPTPYVSSLNAFFGNLFPSELPVVATLGNHEFWARPFEETLENVRNQNAEAPNVHILDAEPSVEALARYSVPREVTCSVLKWETVLGSLVATPKVP